MYRVWCFIPGLLTILLQADARALDRDEAPEAFGINFVNAAAVQPRVLPPLQSAPEAEQWERRIQEREWAQGPYGAAISETLLDAGNYFHSRGDYRSAIAHWRRAVHLVRVNDGLYSQLQLPTLQQLLDAYLAIGDLESAGEIQSYLFHLNGETRAPGDPEHIAATVAWADWERMAWLRNPDPGEPESLLSVWRLLNRETRENDEKTLTVDQLEPLVLAQMRVLYVVSVSDFGLDRETEMMLGRQYGSDPNVDRSQIQMLQDSAYTRGRQRLEKLDERLAGQGLPGRRAFVQLAMGDWHLWNGHSTRAGDSYREAWRMLDEAGQPELQTAWFGEPVELPADGILWDGAASHVEFADSSVVWARFDVTERGRPRNIDTEPADPEQKGRAIRLYKMLRDSRFRPRLEAGEPVATAGLRREYRIK